MDLAGLEAVAEGKEMVAGANKFPNANVANQLRLEGQNINKQLLALGRIINLLKERALAEFCYILTLIQPMA